MPLFIECFNLITNLKSEETTLYDRGDAFKFFYNNVNFWAKYECNFRPSMLLQPLQSEYPSKAHFLLVVVNSLLNV